MADLELIYEGKCKKVYNLNEEQVLLEFKDALTAFNGKKVSSFKGKGQINRDMTSLIFQYLQSKEIPTHWVSDQGESGMIAQKIKMIPLEVVMRNYFAGSTAKKFQKEDGAPLDNPLFELYYKDESLGDPFISEDQAFMLEACTAIEIEMIRESALKINKELVSLFSQAGMILIDFKLEFGKTSNNEVILGDEISADSCRIWDSQTKEKMDKDRFRLDLGNVESYYKKILDSLKKSK